MKKKIHVIIGAMVLSIVVAIMALVAVIYERSQVSSFKSQLTQMQADLPKTTRTVYVASTDIPAGEPLLDGVNVSVQSIQSETPQDVFMSDAEIGQKARIEIKKDAAIQKTMVAEQDITKDIRNVEVSVVNLTTRQKDHDIVDIRILFPDGTDYVVLSKKELTNLDGTIFDLLMNEDEIVRFDSAMVDAATLGARLYTTKYVETNLQDEAVCFYPVKQTTLDLISSDPNILEAAQTTLNSQVRQSLEERMMSLKAAIGEDQELSADFHSKIMLTSPKDKKAAEETGESTEEPVTESSATTGNN